MAATHSPDNSGIPSVSGAGDEPEAANQNAHPGHLTDRGDACFRRRDFDRSIADYSEAIRLIQTDRRFTLSFTMLATAYHSRSIAYRQKGDLDSADADLREAKRIGYDDASMRFNEQRLGVEGDLGTAEIEMPRVAIRRVDIDEALKVMRPYMRFGVMLERIWPPRSASSSQIGGFPNWPADWKWPSMIFEDGKEVSLDFLAQVDLGDLPDVEQRGLLPKGGMLYFFALSQSHEPLGVLGRDAWRVLYYPGDASAFPTRPPPADAGWNLDEMDHTRSPAAEFRDPDRRELIPRCPVRPVAAPSWTYPESSEHEDAELFWRAVWDKWSGSAPPATTFEYDQALLPSHVEDALLQLNYARNAWFDGAVDFDRVIQHFNQGNGDLDVHVLSVAYRGWHDRVMSIVARLRSKGRATALTEFERSAARAVVAESSALLESLTGRSLGLDPRRACITSLATLLLDHPEVADNRADEIAAAHPARVAAAGSETHRMLGYGCSVQGDIPEGSVLLLQLGSDRCGPRFAWWDMGNITFWISKDNLASLRFDRATAEIQGY